jgi:hypothetical protein
VPPVEAFRWHEQDRQRQAHDAMADTHRGHLARAPDGLPHDEDREQGNDERG